MGKSKLGLFHALYSIGGLVGVLFGGTLLQFGYQPLYVFIYLAIAMIVPTLMSAPHTFSQVEEREIESRHLVSRSEEEYLARNNHSGLQLTTESVRGMNTVVLTGDNDEQRLGIANTVADDVMGLSQPREGWRGEDDDDDVEMSQRRQSSSQDIVNDNVTNTNDVITPNIDISITTTTTTTNELPNEDIDYYRMGLMAMLGFLAYMGEGSVGDWSTVFLTLDLKAEPLVGTLGLAFFDLVVAIGRLSLDWLVIWIDRKRLLQWAGLIAAIGLGIVALAPSLTPSSVIPVVCFLQYLFSTHAVISTHSLNSHLSCSYDVIGSIWIHRLWSRSQCRSSYCHFLRRCIIMIERYYSFNCFVGPHTSYQQSSSLTLSLIPSFLPTHPFMHRFNDQRYGTSFRNCDRIIRCLCWCTHWTTSVWGDRYWTQWSQMGFIVGWCTHVIYHYPSNPATVEATHTINVHFK